MNKYLEKMLKLLVLMLAITSSCLAANPGVVLFASTDSLDRIKTTAWPMIAPEIQNRKIDINQKVAGFTLSDAQISVQLEAKDLQISMDPGTNSIIASAKNVKLTGEIKYEAKPLMWTVSGKLKITEGIISNLSLNLKLEQQESKDKNGMVPKANFNQFTVDIQKLTLKAEGNAAISALFNTVEYLLEDTIKSQIMSQLQDNADLKNGLSKAVNDLVLDKYTAFPIPNTFLAISTYLSGDVKVHPNGVLVPLEGFAYDVESYKKTTDCVDIEAKFAPDSIKNNIFIALGDCTIRSAVDVFVDSGKRISYTLKGNTDELTAEFGMAKWENSEITFLQDNIKLGLAMVGVTTVDKQEITASANNLINVSLKKKTGLHYVSSFNITYLSVKDKNGQLMTPKWIHDKILFGQMFPGFIQDQAIASYDIKVDIEKTDNLKITGFPDKWLTSIADLQKKNPINTNFDVPQFCIPNSVVCISQLDIRLNPGFISVTGDFKEKPGVETLEKIEF